MMIITKNIKVAFCLILFSNIVLGKTVVTKDSLIINTVLFKITNPETKNVSYLFGTHHAFGKSFFDSLKNATDALIYSQILFKENLNIPGHLAENIINKRNTFTKWSKYLNKDNYQFVQSIFSSSKVDFSKMTPTELYVFLSRYHKEKNCLAKTESDSYFSLDDYISSVAEQHNLKLIGLETTEEQLEIINKDVEGMPKKVHKKRLLRLIERIKYNSLDDCSEIEWYRKMNFDYKFNQPCQNSLILTDRNNKWMVPIRNHLKTNNCFIAVGLSHLMFECGLINQLRELGYTITPIEVK